MPLAAAGLGGMFYFTCGVILQGSLPPSRRSLRMRAASAIAVLRAGSPAPATACAAVGAALLRRANLCRSPAPGAGVRCRARHRDRPLLAGDRLGYTCVHGFAVLRKLFAALSHTRSVMMVLAICIAGNAVLNWVLVFGNLGAPALGVNQWLMFAGLALCTRIVSGREIRERAVGRLRATGAASDAAHDSMKPS